MRVGLLGYGFMGGAHLAAMLSLPDMTPVVVATRTRPEPDAPAKGNLDLKSGPLPDSVAWTSDWEGVLADPSIDAVDICLPTHLHKQVLLRAFAHGKHVLCEKPMALTSADCDEVLAAAQAAGMTFMVAQVLRFMFPYQYAAEFIRSNGADAITHCTLQRSTGYPQWGGWLADEARSGGAILDLLSHDLDQALLWFGTPESVKAIEMGVVDTAHAELRYANGLVVEVNGGWLETDAEFSASFDIQTESAALTFSLGKLLLFRDGVDEEIAIPEQDAYADEIAYFAACCGSGTVPDRCPPQQSAQAVQLALLLKQSRAENGRELSWQ